MERLKSSIFHDRTKQFCVNNNDGSFDFILRAHKNYEINVCISIDGEETPLAPSGTRGSFAYYSVKVRTDKPVVRYFFKIDYAGANIFYNGYGALDHYEATGDFELSCDFHTPDWAKGAIMYQIMVDRFCNGDETNDVYTNEYAYIGKCVSKVHDWSENPAADGTRQFYGGDLQGVINKLEYLYKLGVEVIYFNPIFVSPSNHKYDTQDYDYVDPHFGKIVNDGGELLHHGDTNNQNAQRYKRRTTDLENLEASNRLFIELVEKAHKLGIKIIIDGVFNHCGSFNKWMDKEKLYEMNPDYSKGAYISKESPYNSYFHFNDEKWPYNNYYEGWWGFDTLPKLNYEGSEKLCQYIIDIAKKWVSPPFNVDGWRLDVAADLGHSSEFNHKLWKRFRKAVKEANPEAIIIAEHYGDANSWLQGDEWDTIMNYDAFMDPVSWFLTGVDKHSDTAKPEYRGDASLFHQTMLHQYTRLQPESLLVAMNELSNHDHSRWLTRTNKMVGRIETSGYRAASQNIDEAIFKQGVVMQMTLPGAPTLYYGDEAGVCGWTDPDNRRTYPWGKENLEILEFYREAICIHKQNEVLKTGSYMNLTAQKDILCYARFNREMAVVTAINTSDGDVTIKVPVWKLGVEKNVYEKLLETFKEFYNCSRTTVVEEDGYIEISIKPNSSVIYRTR